jgi:pilus assembly protein Flp/PilA
MFSCKVSRAVFFLRDETGQDLVEYALVVALIGLGAIASMKSLTSKIGVVFSAIVSQLTAAA